MKQSITTLFIFCYLLSSAQQTNYIFRHIDQANGLLHNDVWSITQDRKGFIWIGTEKGLQRYDGLRFLNYQDKLNILNKNSFAVKNLYADNKNQIWLTTSSQLGKLELLKNKFTSYDITGILKDSSFKYETYIDSHNQARLLGEFAVYYYDTVTKKMALYTFDLPSAAFNRSGNIIKDSEQNETWATSWEGLLLFDHKTKKVYSTDYNPTQHPLLKQYMPKRFLQIMLDGEHNIWLTTWDHLLYKYNQVTKKISTYYLSDINKTTEGPKNNGSTLFVYCMFQDNKSNIWLGTENAGLLKYNRQHDNFDYLISAEENKQGIQYNYNIFCIFQDKEENLWLGTDKGINIFNPYHNYFQSIHHRQNNSASLPKNEITSFIETKGGDILIGTWGGGIALYDSKLHFKKNIFLKGASENNLVWCFIKNDDALPDNYREKIWVGCQHGYLHIYDPFNEKITTVHPPQFAGSTIRCMQKDDEGNIWFGLHNGKIAKWDKLLNRFFSYNDSLYRTIAGSQTFAPVYNIFIDHAQNFWISTEYGFKQFDPVKRIYTSVYLPDKNNGSSISAQSIRGIEQYNDSTLIIGTLNGGLNFFNTKTKAFSNLTINNGLPSGTIYAIKKDDKNNIWLTTDYNLYRFKIQEKKIIAYNIEPGMINSSFVSDNFYQLHDGRWLTGTSTEVILFHPDSLSRQSNDISKVSITGFKIFDKTVFIDSLLSENKPLKLDYKQNFITVEFASLDFSNIQQTKYFYRLSGVDKDWVNAGTNGFANYTNLDPGNYTFNVKTEQGNNRTQITSLSISITPPFWKTWWFYTLLVFTFIILAYSLLRKRINVIRHEAEMKNKIAETEMQALRAQMNPHFIFNCINAIDNLIQTNQKEKATTYLARFAKLIRVVLDSSKNNVVPFHKDYEALNLFLQLEQFRCSNKFTYELNADEEILQGDYKVPPLLVQPFIENAIHHGLMNKSGNDKKLLVQIGVEDDKIKYLIADNGVGRQKALQIKNLNKPEHISYGIQISTERIHLYNKNGKEKDVVITDLYNDGKPAGTKVEVCIKINNGNN